MIKIKNLHYCKQEENDIRVHRPFLLGNPYTHMTNASENSIKVSSRQEAIDKYLPYFLEQYKTNKEFKEGIDIITLMASKSDINLCCWCFPCACHADIIKKFIEYKLKKENINVSRE